MDQLESKISSLLNQFRDCSKEQLYERIISLGRSLPQLPVEKRSDNTKVTGCQSEMHIDCKKEDGKLYFLVYSDALFSRGLAAILLYVYSGCTSQEIISTPPAFLEQLHIKDLLSPGRAQGLLGIFIKILNYAKNN